MSQKKHAAKWQAHNISQEDNALVLQQLEQYHHLAQGLRKSGSLDEAEIVLAPIAAMSEGAQVVLMKALGAEDSLDAADLLQAVNTLSKLKEVRKEARRSLIRLEGSDTYPQWRPPSASPLEMLANALSEPQEDEDRPFLFPDSIFPVLSPYDGVITFLTSWAQSNYQRAYALLTVESPLREGLSQDEWVERRSQWNEQAHPANINISFIQTEGSGEEDEDVEDELDDKEEIERDEILDEMDAELDEDDELDEKEEEPHDGSKQVMQVGWSLEFTDTPSESAPIELPMATISYKETGRHWFWTSYTFVMENGEWRIQSMADEGANALNLSEEELQQRLQAATDHVTALANEIEIEDDKDEEDFDEDFDDEGEDDEDDFDDLEFPEEIEQYQELMGIVTRCMHYCDAVIASAPEDSGIYETAYEQATLVQDPERAAAYSQLLAEHFPDQRGPALRQQAIALVNLANKYDQEERDDEDAAHFIERAEQLLRESIEQDQAPMGNILLAQTLLAQNKQLDEAETLLEQARPLVSDDREITLVEAGLAKLAQDRDEKEKALSLYQHAAELSPDFPGVWFNIGSLQSVLHQYDEAEQNLRKSIEVQPEEARAYASLAILYMQHQKDLDQAQEVLEEGLEIAPDMPDLLALLALVYVQRDDWHRAEELLREAEDIDPDLPIVQNTRKIFDQRRAELREQRKQRQAKSNKPHNKKKR
jgi:tetratricopeptide (TPR) repeat protein